LYTRANHPGSDLSVAIPISWLDSDDTHGEYINDVEEFDGCSCTEPMHLGLGNGPGTLETDAHRPGWCAEQDDAGRSGPGADQDDAGSTDQDDAGTADQDNTGCSGPGADQDDAGTADQDDAHGSRRRPNQDDAHGPGRPADEGGSGGSGAFTAYDDARSGADDRSRSSGRPHPASTAGSEPPQAEPTPLIRAAGFDRPNPPSAGIRPGVLCFGWRPDGPGLWRR
jgi:hypothetical protein